MPTIHLSVPEKVYRELKEAAEVYGIQITDLVKVFIRNNIEAAKKGKLHSALSSSDELEKLVEKQGFLENLVKDQGREVERQVRIIMSMLRALEDRLSSLELELEEIREKVEGEAPIIEPELIDR